MRLAMRPFETRGRNWSESWSRSGESLRELYVVRRPPAMGTRCESRNADLHMKICNFSPPEMEPCPRAEQSRAPSAGRIFSLSSAPPSRALHPRPAFESPPRDRAGYVMRSLPPLAVARGPLFGHLAMELGPYMYRAPCAAFKRPPLFATPPAPAPSRRLGIPG